MLRPEASMFYRGVVGTRVPTKVIAMASGWARGWFTAALNVRHRLEAGVEERTRELEGNYEDGYIIQHSEYI